MRAANTAPVKKAAPASKKMKKGKLGSQQESGHPNGEGSKADPQGPLYLAIGDPGSC